MVTICGWLSAETARASCEKRRLISGSENSPGGRSFRATFRPRSVSSARKTSPIPPAPSFLRTRKRVRFRSSGGSVLTRLLEYRKPAARHEIGERQRDHDRQPEEPARDRDLRQPRAVLD